MKFWQSVSFSETDQLVEIAKAAEEAGFEGVLLSDHLFFPEKLQSKYPYSPDGNPGFDGTTPFPEPWATIAAMAAVTTRLRFSTLVYILPLRNPLEVAKATATVSILSGGRLALGAGAGWMKDEFDVLGVDYHTRGKRFDEMIELMRKLWTGEMLEHHGTFFDFDRLQMCPAPAAPVPIWIGGISKPALRRAAVRCDGWLGSGHDEAQALELLGALRRLRREAGRGEEPFEAMVPLITPPDPDVFRRLEEQGATSTVSYPFALTIGPTSTIEQKRDAMRRYGDEVIATMSGD
jgi:probable F420-dependent oxidoreductase